MIHDLPIIFSWWFSLFIIGLGFLPPTNTLFDKFLDKGYLFSKVIGTLCISYVVFTLGTMHLLSFSLTHIALITFLLFIICWKYGKKSWSEISLQSWIFILIEEFLFLVSLTAWSFVRGFQPDIRGLEKFMDFGFVNSILATDYFPAKDIWLSPFSINYYYFGHYITALLIKINHIPSSIGYNLMIATLFALSFCLIFAIIINLIRSVAVKPVALLLIGLLTSSLAVLGGNLHTIYTFFSPYQNENPVPFWTLTLQTSFFPNNYWYPNATRFIYNTIHEFPLYSFVVSDLHGHVLGIPIILSIIALLVHMYVFDKKITKKIIFIPFLLSCAYMTNAWDGPIYLLLSILIIFFTYGVKNLKKTILLSMGIIGLFILFSLPFSLFFKPFVAGIGVLCAPSFLTDIGRIGPFLFEENHCQKSPLWQLFILYGFFYIWACAFLITIKNFYKITRNDIFILCLLILSTILIVIPEFIYFKDIYPAHYRANTMFKLGYQAFIMLTIVTGYSIFQVLSSVKLITVPVVFLGIYSMILVLMYPYFAISSYYNGLTTYRGIDGTAYLKQLYPSDLSAINWIKKNIRNQPVILEAQGDSYTDYGRVSVHTGNPTVLGWTVHEWLWRGTYSIPGERIPEIQNIYESPDINLTRKLLKKYTVSYVFIGTLEKEKYPNLNENKFKELGTLVYNSETKIYKIK